jgi:hypothetical protein
MARSVRTVTSTTIQSSETKRNRRTPDQIVADLQAEIEAVKARAAEKEARANPDTRALIAAARFVDRSADDCGDETKRALEAARAILGQRLSAMGLRLPQRRSKRQEAA